MLLSGLHLMSAPALAPEPPAAPRCRLAVHNTAGLVWWQQGQNYFGGLAAANDTLVSTLPRRRTHARTVAASLVASQLCASTHTHMTRALLRLLTAPQGLLFFTLLFPAMRALFRALFTFPNEFRMIMKVRGGRWAMQLGGVAGCIMRTAPVRQLRSAVCRLLSQPHARTRACTHAHAAAGSMVAWQPHLLLLLLPLPITASRYQPFRKGRLACITCQPITWRAR